MDVLHDPTCGAVRDANPRSTVPGLLFARAGCIEPGETIVECRDGRDDVCLERTIAAGAEIIAVSAADNWP
jgi:hypothetical protein